MTKTILITGASAGIGKATAELLAREGHRLILTARRANKLKELADKREKLGIFIGGSKLFGSLPTDEQGRLRRQFDVMIQYEGILTERIDHFPGKP